MNAPGLERDTPAIPSEADASAMAALLRLIANEKRLLVMFHLLNKPELSVGEMVQLVGLSQSALSQHLALLREAGLVATRRDAQLIYYRLADVRVPRVLALMLELPMGASAPFSEPANR